MFNLISVWGGISSIFIDIGEEKTIAEANKGNYLHIILLYLLWIVYKLHFWPCTFNYIIMSSLLKSWTVMLHSRFVRWRHSGGKLSISLVKRLKCVISIHLFISSNPWTSPHINHICMFQPPNIQRSSIVDGNNLWTSPVPYVLDSGLGKYYFSFFFWSGHCLGKLVTVATHACTSVNIYKWDAADRVTCNWLEKKRRKHQQVQVETHTFRVASCCTYTATTPSHHSP